MSKQITLKKLTLFNFKGVKEQVINFNAETSIFGDNATGKTSQFDAFTYVLFGKDSEGRTTFGIKTRDSKGIEIPQIEHFVEAVILVNGEEQTIRRTLKEKWVKKRGTLNSEFSGNITEYLWNDAPKSQKEFQDKVDDLLNENLFKIITNPIAFNSLKWTECREILIHLSGDVSDEDIAKGSDEFKELLVKMENKSLKELKSETAFKIKKLNDEIKTIPTRVDEVFKSMPEELEFDLLEKDKKAIDGQIQELEFQLEDKSKAYENKLDEKNKLTTKVFDQEQIKSRVSFKIKNEIENEFSEDNSPIEKGELKLSELTANIQSIQNDLDAFNAKKTTLETTSTSLKAKMDKKRKEWEEENSKTLKFDDNSFDCPTCKRELDNVNIEKEKEKMIDDFKTDQSNTILIIQKEGKAFANEKKITDKAITDLEIRITDSESNIKSAEVERDSFSDKLTAFKETKTKPINQKEELKKRLSINKEYVDAEGEVNRLEAIISEEIVIDNSKIKEAIKVSKTELEDITTKLSAKTKREDSQKRIDELKTRENDLAQQIANIEKVQFSIENFEKAKANSIENKVNKMFKIAKFKLFETQINGAEVPCCITLINGVPFSDANTAARINAGVDIINVLSEHYGVTAPIFIDSRESVVKLIDSNSQIINLIVCAKDKTLRVE